MRRRGVKLKDAPGTVAMGHGGKCKSCQSTYQPGERPEKESSLPKADDPRRMSETVSALEAWMNRNRGVTREARNPIRYRADDQSAP